MKAEKLRDFLKQREVEFTEKEVPYGTQFKCANGESFIAYTTGKVVCGGKRTDLSKAVERLQKPSGSGRESVALLEVPSDRNDIGPDKRVFIVYGHDDNARKTLELLLRRMGLEPIILQQLPAGGDTIIEKLERYLGEHNNVGFSCVLLTPDDKGHQKDRPEEITYRARQNVILELGMVLARLGRRRVAILMKESVEKPSDIAGLIYIPFKETVEE